MKITLVRHTEVEEAYHKRYNGHIDIGLSKKGQEQAKTLAKHFQTQLFDAVFCSDLLRAKETLQPFAQVSQAIYTQKLREKSWGKHEGMSFDEIIAEGEIEYQEFEQWIDALDGEPYAEYIQRVRTFFLEYLPRLNAVNVLVVTHAGVIRVLMGIVQELSLVDAFSLDVPYASYVVYDTELQTFKFVS
ncbi:histidine phosphatase family protein [Sulfurimonas sp.]|uniref:histidine phosphatase family protein n=1 Tax=Sulfurimonas sp. TaxID=2022749 RepID=UPI0026140625|nr:histidine phosphatase family protein [Sulfurimonas sp.]